jgi:hypothetical protein
MVLHQLGCFRKTPLQFVTADAENFSSSSVTVGSSSSRTITSPWSAVATLSVCGLTWAGHNTIGGRVGNGTNHAAIGTHNRPGGTGNLPKPFPVIVGAQFIIAQPVPTGMTKPRPLALSDEQLVLVQQGSTGLPPEWHDRFLDAVTDQLLLLKNITDTDVTHAVAAVPVRIMMAA